MDFVKKNLITIISAGVAVLSLVLIFLGISSVSDVKEAMAETEQQLSAVQTLAGGVSVPDPKGGSIKRIPTAKIVEKMKNVSAQSKAKGYKLLEASLKENVGYDPKTEKIKRIPMLEGIFPKPINDAQPYRFRSVYKDALEQILNTIQAGTVPSADDPQGFGRKACPGAGFFDRRDSGVGFQCE